MPVPTAWQFCPKQQSCVHSPELVPCSPQLALRVQMHELCVCPMLVLNAYLHSQDPVFDLMCVPTVMHAKKVRWLVQACCNSPCACSGRTAPLG
jgi:hypothetical protein